MKAIWTLALALSVIAGCTARAGESVDDAEATKDPGYTIATVVAPAPVKKGTEAKLEITITPKAPWVLKTSTPLKINLAASAGVKLDKTTLKADDIANPDGTAKVVGTALTAESTGEKSIHGDLSFFLCTDQICQRFQDTTETGFVVE
ncbi:MAG: hypothetical protein A2289_11545 [Deltaproteobacteria bacterium RIFOXYA12_FULL_58_15]|nr:MAG: hypothetical protein A2289_11545 [Deltaproteobacteria bacterium RIFOXYA12_FULL_58_15]